MYRKVFFLISLAILWGTVCFAHPLDDNNLSWEEFVDIVEDIPENRKYSFIRYNYLKGYAMASEGNLKSENLAVAIFHLVADELPETMKNRLVSGKPPICFPLPVGCVDPGDPGIRPM